MSTLRIVESSFGPFVTMLEKLISDKSAEHRMMIVIMNIAVRYSYYPLCFVKKPFDLKMIV